MPKQHKKIHSNTIRNRIIAVFVIGLFLIVGFGGVMYYYSNRAAQTINDSGNFSTPITADQGTMIAYDVGHIARFSFLFLSLGGVVFMALMFDLMFRITPALKRLTFAVNEIDSGNFGYRIHLPVQNELGELGDALNQALDKVLVTERALAKEKADIELVVEERTRQLRFEEAKFLASINGLPLGFMLADSNERILMLNPAMGHLLKLTADSDTQFDSNVASAGIFLRKLLNMSQKSLLDGETQSTENVTDDGRYLRALFSPLKIKDGNKRYVVIVVEDITEAKIVEKSKQEFFSIATHELRTPLTAIRGATELIEDFYKDALKDERLNRLIGNIHNSSDRLLGIVNDFLDASRLEQGKIQLKLQTVQLHEVVQTVLNEITTVAEEKLLYVKADLPELQKLPLVYADPERVEQILYNLIGNALKFVETGGVTISASVQESLIKVFITDTGRGISPENQQLLFRKFQQANHGMLERDSSPGTGLGLYISKLLAEEMGGSVGLESSQPDIGSCFSFTLPLESAVLLNDENISL